jgi:hypothetical protein
VLLPFTQTEFFDVFGAYNAALWPAALALWLISLGLVLFAVRASTPPHRALSALLAVHWAWSAVAYHAAFFTRINPAAWLFAGLFLTQAAVFAWVGVVRGRLRFSTGRSLRHVLAGALVTYALAYPLINLAQGLVFPRVPTFGVPCPTTILTLGLLLAATPPSWSIAIIPVAWAVVGGSAALLLGVRADLTLFLAAALLITSLATTKRRHVG